MATSPDLLSWEIRPPFWAPYDAYAMDCPQVFRENGKWYIIYSPFDKLSYGTVYRFSNSLEEPWVIPKRRGLDGRRFYAAKSISNGKRRFAFSWVHSRKDESNTGHWEHSGRMAIPHEMVFEKEGDIAIKCPDEVLELYSKIDFEFKPEIGKWVKENNKITCKNNDQFSYGFITYSNSLGEENLLIKANIEIKNNNAGFLIRANDNLTEGFILEINPSFNKVTLDRFPQPLEFMWEEIILMNFNKPSTERDISTPLVERPLKIDEKELIKVLLFISGSLVEVYIENKIALTHRIYKPEYNCNEIGIFTEGDTVFNEVQLECQNK